MNENINISLDEEDFKCLVRGGILHIGETIKVSLKDIGFFQMEAAIDFAAEGNDIYKDRKR